MTKVAPPGESQYNTGSPGAANGVFFIPSLIRRLRSLSSLWNSTVKFSVRKLQSWGYSVVKVAWY